MARFTATVAKLGIATMGVTLAVSVSTLGSPARAWQGGGPEMQAQAPAPAAAGGDEALLEKGRQLFNDWSCGACHVMKDAGGSGPVGPAIDGNPNLTRDLIHARISNGQGQMPGFAGQMTDEEINLLTDYVLKAAIKG